MISECHRKWQKTCSDQLEGLVCFPHCRESLCRDSPGLPPGPGRREAPPAPTGTELPLGKAVGPTRGSGVGPALPWRPFCSPDGGAASLLWERRHSPWERYMPSACPESHV